ncbi:MAG: OsmC family protein [Thermoplasmatota archaeon]
MENSSIKVEMENLEGYKFKAKFDKESMGEIITDETEEVGGDEEGPNPGRLLAAASLNCLMASLIFCLKKKRVDLKSLKGEIEGTVERIDGRLRITHLDVHIFPGVREDDKHKLEKCVDIFEDYCIVTQSIRNGIDVDVKIEPEV